MRSPDLMSQEKNFRNLLTPGQTTWSAGDPMYFIVFPHYTSLFESSMNYSLFSNLSYLNLLASDL